MAHAGDKSKQPLECESEFLPFNETMPKTVWDAPNAKGRWTKCQNIKQTYQDYDKESYTCEVCGKNYNLYYDEMR